MNRIQSATTNPHLVGELTSPQDHQKCSTCQSTGRKRAHDKNEQIDYSGVTKISKIDIHPLPEAIAATSNTELTERVATSTVGPETSSHGNSELIEIQKLIAEYKKIANGQDEGAIIAKLNEIVNKSTALASKDVIAPETRKKAIEFQKMYSRCIDNIKKSSDSLSEHDKTMRAQLEQIYASSGRTIIDMSGGRNNSCGFHAILSQTDEQFYGHVLLSSEQCISNAQEPVHALRNTIRDRINNQQQAQSGDSNTTSSHYTQTDVDHVRNENFELDTSYMQIMSDHLNRPILTMLFENGTNQAITGMQFNMPGQESEVLFSSTDDFLHCNEQSIEGLIFSHVSRYSTADSDERKDADKKLRAITDFTGLSASATVRDVLIKLLSNPAVIGIVKVPGHFMSLQPTSAARAKFTAITATANPESTAKEEICPKT